MWHMTDKTTGPQLAEARRSAGITAKALGRAMGYGGVSPHSRVFQLESQVRVSPLMAARYRAALASLSGEAKG